ncbi:response regulator [Desulfonema ishimotonii]|uniref:Response regulator n=1 Tax=Desulfonema ishimotonii TaxID=45657 RepID=A0A401G4F8_9BACT|nr:response regulator [Desulfonema ishimotonii]GBC64015.1 response regulator [Desulfonema ishimotonii]
MIKTILIVDDSPVARKMLKSCLLKNGNYEIHEAVNGEDGVQKFQALSPDVIFMDLTMPVLDGYQAIEQIRALDGDAIIIVTSADVQKKARERVEASGVSHIVQKPARPDPIREALAKVEAIRQTPSEGMFSEEERDILQEVMNIAFGNAAADLGEVINMYLDLSTPSVHIASIGEMGDWLTDEMALDFLKTSMIIQNFWGDFSGFGLLFLPDNAGRELILMLQECVSDEPEEKPMAAQEKEVLLEVGNILIGACVGKICELLKTFVTYNPPRVLGEGNEGYRSFISSFDASQTAIVMETLFRFNTVDIRGQLLVITNQDAIEWLRKALHDFMEYYE